MRISHRHGNYTKTVGENSNEDLDEDSNKDLDEDSDDSDRFGSAWMRALSRGMVRRFA